MRQVSLLLCLCLIIGHGLGAVWEFGEDRRQSVVISTNNGDISILQKTTRVQFTVPACHKVVYVRVQVDNDLTTPAVTFEKETNIIIIHYKLLQSSLSKYFVVAKAIKQKNCGEQPRKKKSKKYRYDSYEDYESDERPRRRPKHRNKKSVGKQYGNYDGDYGSPYGRPELHGIYMHGCRNC